MYCGNGAGQASGVGQFQHLGSVPFDSGHFLRGESDTSDISFLLADGLGGIGMGLGPGGQPIDANHLNKGIGMGNLGPAGENCRASGWVISGKVKSH